MGYFMSNYEEFEKINRTVAFILIIFTQNLTLLILKQVYSGGAKDIRQLSRS